jgi:hypothetical protein
LIIILLILFRLILLIDHNIYIRFTILLVFFLLGNPFSISYVHCNQLNLYWGSIYIAIT